MARGRRFNAAFTRLLGPLVCMVSDRVSLEKEEPTVLRVTGVIVESKLQLLGFETDLPLQCISFDKTYYGTDVVRSAVLYNNSPESMRFVMVLNDTIEGQVCFAWCTNG